MAQSPWNRLRLSRREFVAATIAGAFGLTACGRPTTPASSTPAPISTTADPLAEAIRATEAARPHTGRTVAASLTPQPVTVDLGGPSVRTLAYGESIPGPLIRANVGD